MKNIASEHKGTSYKQHDYFISYRAKDNNGDNRGNVMALLVRKKLEELFEGCDVYLNTDTKANPDFIKELENSKRIVILLQSFSFERDKSGNTGENFRKEIDKVIALIRDNKLDSQDVIPLKLEPFDNNRINDELFKELKSRCTYKHVYNNGEDFEDNLERALLNYDSKELRSKFESQKKELDLQKKKFGKTKKLILALAMAVMALVILLFSTYLKKEFVYSQDAIKDNKLIVFAGGGTVYNYIKSKKDSIDVNKLPGSIYLHMPSEQALSMLWDENNNDTNQRYGLIVLSAIRMDVSRKTDTMSFKEKFRIVEYPIGEVPLRVQVRPRLEDGNSISVKFLRELIANGNYVLHITSRTSGTFLMYNKILNIDNFKMSDYDNKMEEFSQYSKKADDSMLVLGNDLFCQNFTDDIKGSIGEYPVVDDACDTVKLAVYVYVVARRINDDSYEIDPHVKNYLRRLHLNDTMSFSNVGPLVKRVEAKDFYRF